MTAVTLRNGIVRNCNGKGIEANTGGPVIEGWEIDCSDGSQPGIRALNNSKLILTGSTIANGMEMTYPDAGFVSGNQFVNYASGRPFTLHPERIQEIFDRNTVSGATSTSTVEVSVGTITKRVTWPVHSYRVLGSVSVIGGSTELNAAVLVLQAGTHLRFKTNTGLTVANSVQKAGLHALGTASDPVVFTSDAATPAPGNWRNLTFNGATLDSSRLVWARVEYAGAANLAAVAITENDLMLENDTNQNNAKDGVATLHYSPGSVTKTY
jgi:hypothetical protein